MKLIIYSLLIILWSNMVMAQRVGKLVDIETKKPIPYVNMQVLGTRTGYTTDYDGKYKIGIESNETIIISAIGYDG